MTTNISTMRAKTLKEFFGRKSAPKRCAVAREIGISKAHMVNIVNGKRRPSWELAGRISELTGISRARLMDKAAKEGA